MRVSRLALLAIVAASPLLGGCQSIFGTSRNFQAGTSLPEQDNPADYAASQMAQGRQALESQQFGLAIVAFRNARFTGKYTAAANNGLGIAYAQIGRPDLAERYFMQAITEAPEDQKYHANLARLYVSIANSQVRMAEAGSVENSDNISEPTAVLLPGTAERSAIRVERPTQQIVRISAEEIRIAAQTDPRRRAVGIQTKPHNPVRRVNAVYPVRIEFGERGSPTHAIQPAREYPIRIEFGKTDPPARAEKPARQYPIRVSLAPSN